MNKYIERLPRQYQFAVKDFYKDTDGWWICLNAEGLYEFNGYASKYTIHEGSQLEAIHQFRECICLKESTQKCLDHNAR